MRRAGRSSRYVFGVWIAIASMIGFAAAVAGLVLRGTGPVVRGTVEAFAAGVILALVSETMIPEAFHGSPHLLPGTRLQVEDGEYDGKQIRALYESERYPLPRKPSSS